MVAVSNVQETKVKKKKSTKKKTKLTEGVDPEKSKSNKKKSVTFESDETSVPITVNSMISNLREQSENMEIDEAFTKLDEESGDEDEEEIINEKEHNKLLKSLGVKERKKRIREKTLPVEPGDKEIEGRVSIADLISSAEKSESLKAVQQLLDCGDSKAPFEEPLPRFQQEQAEREVNYDKSKKEVTKWLPIVKRNRESEHMTYPLFHSQNTKDSREDITSFAMKKKAPTTKLEEEIYEVLAADAHLLERPDHFLTEAEEKTLEDLNAEEAESRREELRKMRALLSYQEEKFRRKNKIKSKTYHKLLKKERIKKEEKALSDALRADPSVAGDEQDKADYLRALERISQKHKVGGRWNKNLLHKNIKDPELKAAMSEQRNLRQKLMEKQDVILGEVETTIEDVEEIEEDKEQERKEEFEVDPNNPWLAVGSILSKETELSSSPVEQSPDSENVTPASDTETEKNTENPGSEMEESGSSESDDADSNEKSIPEGDVEITTEQKKITPENKALPKEGPTLDQETLVDMAFANDDVVAQFVEEKEKIVDAETEKDIDVTLPGWGSWAGIGTSDKPKKRVIKKAGPTVPRKDEGLSHVIINTKKNRKIQPHLVRNLPHPYKNRSVFEREMRQPIGPQWNSVRAFKNMIKPTESVLDGHVIEPMTAPKGFDKVIIRGKRKAATTK